jgi:hypothetical protein
VSGILCSYRTALPAHAQPRFTLTSPTLKDGATIGMDHVFNGFGCSGKNVSPALAWSGAMVSFNLHANALRTATRGLGHHRLSLSLFRNA